MLAKSAVVGEKYLSKNGTPVKVVEFKDDKVILFSEVTKKEISVSKKYPLQSYKEKSNSVDMESMGEKVNTLLSSMDSTVSKSTGKNKPRGETLASVIDPYIFTGGKTVKEIVKLIEKRKLAITEGKELNSNIRARLVNYARKGFKIEKTKDKKVKVIEPGK